MATSTKEGGRVGLAEHGIEPAHARPLEPDDVATLQPRRRAPRGADCRGRPARRRHRQAHRAARRRTSSSSASPAPRTGSGGATSTPRSPRSTSRGCARRSSRTSASSDLYVVDAFAGADPEASDRRPRRSRTTRTTRSSRRRCSSTRPRRSCASSSRRRSSCTRPGSRPIPPRTERAPARSSCCTRRARRC